MKWILAALALAAALPAAAADFRVNTATAGDQKLRHSGVSTASDNAGRFVVAWSSYDGDTDVHGQMFAPNGDPIGGEFQVNTYTTNGQRDAAVAMHPDGSGFVVVWQSFFQDGDEQGIFGQRFDGAGNAVDAEFQVNTYTTGFQYHPDVAMDASGRFTVVWSTLSGGPIRGRRYDAVGVPVGDEFVVDASTTAVSAEVTIDARPTGEFVVAWRRFDGPPYGLQHVLGRIFAADGTPVTGDLRFSSTVGGRHAYPSLDVGDDGRFVVVWEGEAASAWTVVARRFDAAGVPEGPERVVDHVTAGQPPLSPKPVVLRGSNDTFRVVYSHRAADHEVFARELAPTAAGPRFRVNSFTGGHQYNPGVAALGAAGDFVATWTSEFQDGDATGVFGSRNPCRGETPVAGDDAGTTRHDVATLLFPLANDVDPNGGALRVSEVGVPIPSGTANVMPDGTTIAFVPAPLFVGTARFTYVAENARGCTDEATVTVEVTNAAPSAADDTAATSANLPVAVPVLANDGDADGDTLAIIYAQAPTAAGGTTAIDDNGTPTNTGDDRIVYTPPPAYVGGDTFLYRIADAVGASAQAVVTVAVGAPVGLAPVGLAADQLAGSGADGNEVFEPGESATVAPRWRNDTPAAFIFSGTATALGGPTGGLYTLLDAEAHYGALAPGAQGQCYDCYRFSIGGTRPAAHWDAQFTETLSNGAVATWQVHLGESFSDVPRSSVFYRFMETLLHRGVTGGCTPTAYCPPSSTTRAQVAVFVLAAKEGPGYAPPACAAPVFGDVPATSPFCRWVEELARRGVVSGCGGGNYCPDQAVSREQMAVFVLATREGGGYAPPSCGAPMFGDVPASSPFCRWIEELARRGVVSGCGGGNYCPTASVTREQMSVFLTVTFALTLYGL